jgi:hypothetical protein
MGHRHVAMSHTPGARYDLSRAEGLRMRTACRELEHAVARPPIALPRDAARRPSTGAVAWHREQVFLG